MHCFFNISTIQYQKSSITRFNGSALSKGKVLLVVSLFLVFNSLKANSTNQTNKFQKIDIQRADSLLSTAKSIFFSDLSKSEELANKALHIYKNEANQEGVINSLNLIASAKMSTGNYNSAIEVFKNALDQAITINDQPGIGKISNNLGNVYLKSGDYEKALDWFFKSLVIYENIYDVSSLIAINNNIGLIYKNAGNSSKAFEYYNKALEAAENEGMLREQASILYNFASIYLQQTDYSKAITNCQKSILLYEKTNNYLGQIRALTLLARSNFKLEQYELSSQNLNKALLLANKQNVRDEKARIMQHMGFNYLEFGNLLKAKELFQQSLTICEELKLDQLSLDNYRYLAQTDSLLGNYREALGYMHKAQILGAKKQEFSADEKLSELTLKYDFIRKENLYINRELNNKKITVALLISLLGVLVLLSLLMVQQIRLRAQRKISLLTQQNLRSQMNPHFIFNVINSIQYYILKNDKDESARYLNNFARLLRITLENSQKNLVSIKDEIDGLKLYLDLELKRLENKFEYDVIIDENIDELMFKVPSLLIQPFIENSILHGIQKNQAKGKILVELKLKKDAIHCIIEDNGIGRERSESFKTKQQKQRKSYGSSITKTRLQLLNKLYGKELGITYTDLIDNEKKPAGTRVEFDLPVLN